MIRLFINNIIIITIFRVCLHQRKIRLSALLVVVT